MSPGPISMTRGLIEAHLAPVLGRGRVPPVGADVALALDHAVMDAEAGTLAFQAFERSGAAGVAGNVVLACAEWPMAPPAFEGGDELLYVQSAARRFGAHFSRAGNGRAHHVYGARFAAPGRLVFGCAADWAAAGAVGSLPLGVSELELAAALTGRPHIACVPEVWAVRLIGTLPPGVSAHDLVMGLLPRLPSGAGRPAVIEFCGSAVAALSQEARFTVARLGPALGLPPMLFPSDEATREWLRAQGRDTDWKPLAGDPEPEAERAIMLHLDSLEPRVLRASDGADPLPVRDVAGMPVARIVLGADAGLADLLLLAEGLAGRRVATGVEVVVVPGSRQIRAMLGASGALEALTAAGVAVVDAEARLAPAGGADIVLLCGASAAAAGHTGSVLRVGPAIAAASGVAGRISDPREMPPAVVRFAAPERFIPTDVVPPVPPVARGESDIVRGPSMGPLPALGPMVTAVRGVVLQRLPDRVRTDVALSGGPRVWRHRGNPAAMAEHLFSGFDPTFAARARALGGGFVVAGSDYGVGPHRPHLVMAMVALGVRAVIASSFAPGHRAELIRHGVLPLRPTAGMDPGELAVGDELEIPGLPDMLERSKPLVARNLTCGTQISLVHDMTDREIEIVRAGGMLPASSGARGATGASQPVGVSA